MNLERHPQLAAIVLLVFGLTMPAMARTLETPFQLPAFTSSAPRDWLNSAPLTVDSLRGKVVLLDFWTFGCWNCYRSFPWLRSLEKRLSEQPFTVVGIHSPEFEHERDRDLVAAKIEEFQLQHPVMLDNDFRYWTSLDTHYWPAYYLIDKQGRVRHLHVGETHTGDPRAEQIEADIQALLDE